MKQTNNAIKFLMAQYRAIFKSAYIKGLATAVVLTSALAAGQAQAEFYYHNGSSWQTESSNSVGFDGKNTAKYIVGNLVTNTVNSGGTIVNGTHLTVGPDGNITSISGVAQGTNLIGGWISIEKDAVAIQNTLELKPNASVTSGIGALTGGRATSTSGAATAVGNKLIINNIAETSVSSGSFIGGLAKGYTGATATGNLVDIKDYTLGNNSLILGGQATAASTTVAQTVKSLTVAGNTVKLTNVKLGDETATPAGINMIAANFANAGDAQKVDLITADGTGGEGVVISGGTIAVPHIVGGQAKNSQ